MGDKASLAPLNNPPVVKNEAVEDIEAPGTTPAPPVSSLSTAMQALVDRVLHFLSHASHETLGACVVGLGVTTYIVLGRVGLVLIGAFGGVILHATWDGRIGADREKSAQEDGRRRDELGLDVAKRVLQWRTAQTRDEEPKHDLRVYAGEELDYERFPKETAKALDVFTDTIVKDYVRWWYSPVLPDEESFPCQCRRILTAFLLSLSSHLSRKRPADAFLDFVTNASSIIIVYLNELSTALNASPNHESAEAIQTYLKMKPDSNLAHVLDSKQQERKLTMVAEDILQAYLDPKAINCPPVYVFLKEILAQLVLGGTITSCSRPEWINEWIVYGLEESETTKEVMDIVDAGVQERTKDELPKHKEQFAERQDVGSRKDGEEARPQHKRHMSRAEGAMDDAMQEARRLTELMIQEDEEKGRRQLDAQRARQETVASQVSMSSSESFSDATTQGAATPTSSESDRERQDEEVISSQEVPAEPSVTRSLDSTPTTPGTKQSFTSFDQLSPSQVPIGLQDSPERGRREPQQLTLHNATISIFDDSVPGERTSIKAKPTIDYLIQIEPSSSAFPGWMIARKYADFEMLHEVIRRISVITGVRGFAEAHSELPKWKVHTKSSLRTELERYLTDAVRFHQLAESEGMKRFLEKDQGFAKSPNTQAKGFGWPTPEAFGKIGGGMMDVLTKAPKEVAGGGKALFGGVAGVLSGGKKGTNGSQASLSRTGTNPRQGGISPAAGRPSMSLTDSYMGNVSYGRESQESLRSLPKSTMERRGSAETMASADLKSKASESSRVSLAEQRSGEMTRPGSMATSEPVPSQVPQSPAVEETFNLPPLPVEIPDDYASPTRSSHSDPNRSIDAPRAIQTVMPDGSLVLEPQQAPRIPPRPKPTLAASPKPNAKPSAPPLNEQETQVAIELMFAVTTELYTLSSAWQIRRTLLQAAKSFLLRPGNLQLASIQQLLQTSLLDNNLSDSGIAAHIYKLRENSLPTEEEMEIWRRDFPEKTAEQKEELRVKARKLLVSRGMPQALTSVMGAAASGEALGKVFDCLQVESVSRGLVFGLLLQALKVVTH